MLFPTFDFLAFLLVVLAVHWTLGNRPRARTAFLLLASYFFYAAGPKTEPPPTPWTFVGLLVFSTALDFACAHGMQRHAQARGIRNAFLGVSLAGNLGLLGYFKYTDFFVDAWSDITTALGLSFAPPILEVALPVGISFYTFQSLSYSIDVWRGRLAPERSFSRFALFVAFFPQLVAGPIVRASEFLPQLQRGPILRLASVREGMFRVSKGLTKKIILGDVLAARFSDGVFATPEQFTSLEILVALYAFTLQLYADFSGYSDIAIGVGKLMGYELPENFNRPHQSHNLGEFWRRWHMTLSTWLRDYLFYPLGGSRGTSRQTYLNLWVTMFLVGMWHYKPGTSWNFVIYGNLQAFGILWNRWLRARRSSIVTAIAGPAFVSGLAVVLLWGLLGVPLETSSWTALGCGIVAALTVLVPDKGGWANAAFHIFLTFHFTVLSRVFFRADTFEVAKTMLTRMLACDTDGIRPLGALFWTLLLCGTAYHFTPRAWIERPSRAVMERLPGPVLALALAALFLALMFIMEETPRAFIYFAF